MSIIPYGAAILGGGALDPSAAALIAAMTTKPDSVHTNAINTFIIGLKSAGLWSTIDFMCGWGALNAPQSFRINWKNPALIGTAQNSPVFAVDGGYTFDGATNYIDTGWIPSTMAQAVSATSALIGVYERTNVASGGEASGATNGGVQALRLNPRSASNNYRNAVMSAITSSVATTSDSRGLTVANRLSGVFTFYKNGALADTIAPATTNGTLPTLAAFLGGSNSSGSLSLGRPAQEAGLVIGSGWSAGQQATFYTLAQACMTSINAPA